ncbi:MAG TPA: hypothetical protein QF753_06530 [Victivallales bacterium]|nr:hypothetical protein [Victivallales bacterium]
MNNDISNIKEKLDQLLNSGRKMNWNLVNSNPSQKKYMMKTKNKYYLSYGILILLTVFIILFLTISSIGTHNINKNITKQESQMQIKLLNIKNQT